MDDDKIIERITDRPFMISCGTNLVVEIGNMTTRFNSKMIGYSVDEYLVIKMPISWNMTTIKSKLFKGSRIVVRFIEDGIVYGFESEIMTIMFEPVKLMIISYPKIVSQYELRGKKRYVCIIPGKLKIDDTEHPALMMDVSEKGCSITIKAQANDAIPEFKMNDKVTFNCMIPGTDGKLFLSGEIKNLHQDNTRTLLGIEYIDIAEDLQKTLNKFISFMGEAI